MLGKIRKIHFVGIGGIGMSGIAEVLLNLGFTVSGSDLKKTAVTERLEKLGARVFEGHAAENVRGVEVLVVSSAVPPDNPELAESRRLQLPLITRAEMLAELMRLKSCVAVAGAHGKTTVTSMIAVMLSQAGMDPTAVIGGRLDAFGSSARLGKGDLMVVEADESDRSFLYLLPSIAVVTNIDREHLDHYRDIDEIAAAFVSFMNKVPFYGVVVACVDPPPASGGLPLASLLPKVRRRVVTYGLEPACAGRPGADVSAGSLELAPKGGTFEARVKGKSLGRFSIGIPGRHNVQNALAAVGVGLELDLTADQMRSGLERFRGADRRFQVRGEWEGVTLVDDYGHHPTEIHATVEAARLRRPKRLWVIFQPHRYTRTRYLMDEFAGCFDGSDRVYVLDIYPASEPPLPGVTAERLVERMRQLGCKAARYAPSANEVVREVLADARPGDLVLTVGAGTVWKIADTLAESLKAGASSGVTPQGRS